MIADSAAVLDALFTKRNLLDCSPKGDGVSAHEITVDFDSTLSSSSQGLFGTTISRRIPFRPARYRSMAPSFDYQLVTHHDAWDFKVPMSRRRKSVALLRIQKPDTTSWSTCWIRLDLADFGTSIIRCLS